MMRPVQVGDWYWNPAGQFLGRLEVVRIITMGPHNADVERVYYPNWPDEADRDVCTYPRATFDRNIASGWWVLVDEIPPDERVAEGL